MSFHHLHLPFSDENRGLSLSPLVIDLARSFIRLLALFLVVFGVCVFPLIGWVYESGLLRHEDQTTHLV